MNDLLVLEKALSLSTKTYDKVILFIFLANISALIHLELIYKALQSESHMELCH